MANLLDKFARSSIGSAGEASDYLSTISPKGDFARVTGLNAILVHWNNILLTRKGTYDHDPEFGSTLLDYLYEPVDEETQDKIKEVVMQDISSQDDRAFIADVTVNFLSNKKGFDVKVIGEYDGDYGQTTARIDETLLLAFD